MILKGKFIVLEGGEGVGKSTQLELLTKHLQNIGRKVTYFREPGGDPVAEKIREILLDDQLTMEPETEVLLFNAARKQALAKVSRILDEGCDVISDRSYLSTLAYQGHGHGIDLDTVRATCEAVVAKTKPDLMLVLSAPAEVVNARRDLRGTSDRFEKMDENFHERVRKGYLVEAERLDLPVIDASPTIEEIAKAIWQQVEPLVGE